MKLLDKTQELLQQEVSRKEFLKYAGIAMLGLIGISGMIQNLNKALSSQRSSQKIGKGYGASAYGR